MAVTMTKGERTELGQLIRKREKVLKSYAQERSSTLLAEYDAASAKIFHYDDDSVWQAANEEARKAVIKAQDEISQRCEQLGIPKEFAPGLEFGWHGRGHNAVASRRQELRQAAKSRIEALEREAFTKIERLSLEAQTEIVSHGMESEAATKFLTGMPSMDVLMPIVAFADVQQLLQERKAKHRLSWLN